MAQSLFAKLVLGEILRVGKTVGIDHQDVARMEFERGGLIRRKREHSQRHATREQLLYFARGRAEQIDHVVARVQKLSLALGVQEKQNKCDEAVRRSPLAEEFVHAIEDLSGPLRRPEFRSDRSLGERAE